MVVLKRNRSDTVRLVEDQSVRLVNGRTTASSFYVEECSPEGWYADTAFDDIDAAIDEYFDRCNNLTRLLAYLH